MYGCYELLAPISVGHQECLSPWRPREEVYMEQLPRFVAQGESGIVYRLRRSLYDLK